MDGPADRPDHDDLQDDRLRDLSRNVDAMRREAASRPAQADDMRDAQTRVILESHHTLARQIFELSQGQQRIEREVPGLIEAAISRAMERTPHLTDEERRWVAMALKAAGKRAEAVEALITKGLGALLLAVVSLIGWALWDYISAKIRRGE